MPYADLGDYRLYYEEFGSGEPLVFLHGFTLDRRMWYRQVDYFEDRYHVILIDAKGHGLSDAPRSGYGRFDRVADLTKFLDKLGVEKLHLVGLSMGGSTGIGFALEHPERLQTLTLVSTGAAGYNVGKKFSRLDRLAKEQSLEAAMAAWKEMTLSWFVGKRAGPREGVAEMLRDHSGAIWMDPKRGSYPSMVDLEHVHKIAVPTKLIVGELDTVFLRLSRALHERIADSELAVLPGLGHLLNLENPDMFNRELEAFLEKH